MAPNFHRRILLIEDDRDILEFLKELLESEGYIVDFALNGKDALDFLGNPEREMPSLILLDLMMPVMDGFQFRERQRQDPRISAIPVVIMSADGHMEKKIQQTQATDYIKKPFDLDQILNMVKRNSA